jgi:tetratricopeptide (TPR) repeat protein
MRLLPIIALGLMLLPAGSAMAQYAPREWFKFARFKYEQGAFAESLSYLEKAIDADSAYQSAWFLRADVHLALGAYGDALHDIDRGMELGGVSTSTAAAYRLIQGKSLYMMGDYGKAGDALEQSLALDGRLAEGYYYRSLLHLGQGLYPEALHDLRAAAVLDPTRPEYFYEQARVLEAYYRPPYQTELFAGLMENLNTAIRLSPRQTEYLRFKGELLKRHGCYSEALMIYDDLIGQNPDDAGSYCERGMIRMRAEDYAGAVEDFSASIRLGNHDERLYRYRGLCHQNLNQTRAAEQDFTASIDLMRQDISVGLNTTRARSALAEAYIMRGSCLQLLGNNARACLDFMAAQELGFRKGYHYYRKYCGF